MLVSPTRQRGPLTTRARHPAANRSKVRYGSSSPLWGKGFFVRKPHLLAGTHQTHLNRHRHELLDELARRGVVQADGPVKAGRGHLLAVGAVTHGVHRPLLAFALGDQ